MLCATPVLLLRAAGDWERVTVAVCANEVERLLELEARGELNPTEASRNVFRAEFASHGWVAGRGKAAAWWAGLRSVLQDQASHPVARHTRTASCSRSVIVPAPHRPPVAQHLVAVKAGSALWPQVVPRGPLL